MIVHAGFLWSVVFVVFLKTASRESLRDLLSACLGVQFLWMVPQIQHSLQVTSPTARLLLGPPPMIVKNLVCGCFLLGRQLKLPPPPLVVTCGQEDARVDMMTWTQLQERFSQWSNEWLNTFLHPLAPATDQSQPFVTLVNLWFFLASLKKIYELTTTYWHKGSWIKRTSGL